MADGAKPPGVPPETIRWFELLFFGSLMLRAVEIPQFISALSHGLAATISAGIRLFLTLLLPFWLALLVSRTRSNAAKWALVLLLALMMLGILAVYLTETSADLNILVLPPDAELRDRPPVHRSGPALAGQQRHAVDESGIAGHIRLGSASLRNVRSG